MIIQEAVFSALTAGAVPLRVYPDMMPQYPVYPLVTYIVVGGEDDVHMNGSAGVARRLVQVDSWGRTRLGVEQQAQSVKALMLSSLAFSVGAIDVSSAPTYEPDTQLYRASLEFSVHYETP
jgi:Protein of unknown function (DUF3168)